MGYREKYSPRGYECQYHPAKDKDFPLCEMFQQLIKASLVCTHTHTHTRGGIQRNWTPRVSKEI